ncbi:hypothetical protein [Dactylosporangium sp. NPDC000521]|uniref:hypothetical protein n=1 Tax=Dactylosporangium sp. NPDC000521 TaxID=3363975 RepID=UPI003690C942
MTSLADVLYVLGPRARDFGANVADLVSICFALDVLRLAAPLDDVVIEPTTVRKRSDGGFLIVVRHGQLLLASPQIVRQRFGGSGRQVAVDVLSTVADVVCTTYATFLTATAATRRGR